MLNKIMLVTELIAFWVFIIGVGMGIIRDDVDIPFKALLIAIGMFTGVLIASISYVLIMGILN